MIRTRAITRSASSIPTRTFYTSQNKHRCVSKSINTSKHVGIVNTKYRSSSILNLSSPCLLHENLLRFGVSCRSAFSSSATSTPSSSSASSSLTVSNIVKRSLQALLLSGTIAVTTAAGYIYNQVGDDPEGLQRTLSFYSIAIPKYIRFRYQQYLSDRALLRYQNALSKQNNKKEEVMAKEELDQLESEWEELHRSTSALGLDVILDLRGFYIKAGQMGAANIGNAFPPIWQDTFSVLQDGVPPKDFSVIRNILNEEFRGMGYKGGMEDVFESIEEDAIGAASIGQVHRAVLKGNNHEEVVVKIMYPEVERLFRGDVRTLKMFCQVAQPVHVPSLEEVEVQFMTEFDYVKEAMQLENVRNNLMKAGLAQHDTTNNTTNKNVLCVVPKPYLEYCGKRVLVMEQLHGDKLADALRKNMAQHASSLGKTPDQLLAEQKLKLEQARSEGKEMMGPSADEYDKYIALLDAKRRATNATKRMHNLTLGWWFPGCPKKEYEGIDTLPINHAKMIDELMYVHGHEVLKDGYFNGDPHPGNILLIQSKNKRPQLGLIDYGQVKKLSDKDRIFMCKMFIALDDDNHAEIVRLMKEAGFRSKYMNPEIMVKYCRLYFDQDNLALTGGKHIQVFIEELEAADPVVNIPRDLIMVHRTTFLLRGLAHALHQSRSIAKCWRPIAETVLKEEGIDYP